MLCISKYSEMSKLKNPSCLSRRLGCLDNPSDLKTSHCTQWGINEHGSIYCHPNVASFMILHPLTADAVLKCQVITQHSPTCWSTGQFHPIPFSLPYCINCPLHLHFHPSLTGHVSVLDGVQHEHPALFSVLITAVLASAALWWPPPPHPWQHELGSSQCRASYRISNMVTVVNIHLNELSEDVMFHAPAGSGWWRRSPSLFASTQVSPAFLKFLTLPLTVVWYKVNYLPAGVRIWFWPNCGILVFGDMANFSSEIG